MTINVSANSRKVIDVVCLVAIDQANKILATQRPQDKQLGLLWEFPGGKIEKGESAETSLRREIREELSIELGNLTQYPAVTHQYDFATIRLIPFVARVETRPELPHLHAHVDARWIALNDWDQMQWAPADVPIIERLLQTEVNT